MAGAVVDILEVVAVEYDKTQRTPVLLRGRELSLERVLEAPAVEQAGQSVRMSAQALSIERERGIERGSRMGGEQRRHLGLIPIEGRREPARADKEPDVVSVRAKRDQDHRTNPRLGELDHTELIRVEQLEHGRRTDVIAELKRRCL